MSKNYTAQAKKEIELYCYNTLLEQHIKMLREEKKVVLLALKVQSKQ